MWLPHSVRHSVIQSAENGQQKSRQGIEATRNRCRISISYSLFVLIERQLVRHSDYVGRR